LSVFFSFFFFFSFSFAPTRIGRTARSATVATEVVVVVAAEECHINHDIEESVLGAEALIGGEGMDELPTPALRLHAHLATLTALTSLGSCEDEGIDPNFCADFELWDGKTLLLVEVAGQVRRLGLQFPDASLLLDRRALCLVLFRTAMHVYHVIMKSVCIK
jgi:hypothetical protein